MYVVCFACMAWEKENLRFAGAWLESPLFQPVRDSIEPGLELLECSISIELILDWNGGRKRHIIGKQKTMYIRW